MLEKALALAAQGFRIFPCVPNAKLPTITDWPNKATTNEAQIREWWSGSCVVVTSNGKNLKLKKNCNIGICPGDSYVIIDVDIKGDYKTSLAKLKADGLPPTYTVRTPSGGLHLYYLHPGGTIKSVANWMPGIDIRGNGGQGVGPGSVIDGKMYTVATDRQVAALPAHIAFSLPVTVGQQDKPIESSLTTQPEASPYSALPDVVKLGERDDVLFKYACSWRARNYPISQAEILMRELYSRCEPDPPEWVDDPFTVDKALDKLRRAYKDYNPQTATNWMNVVTAEGEVEVQQKDVTTIVEALKRYVFIEKLNRVADLDRHPKNSVLALQEFKNSLGNVYIGKKQMPPKWMNHPKRKTVVDVGYKPLGGRIFTEYGSDYYNTYYGSGLTLPAIADPEKIAVPLGHMRYMFPNVNDGRRFLHWVAFTVQKPDVRIPWAPLIVSSPGVGKGWIYQMLQVVVGRQNCALIGPEDFSINSQFNEFMSGKVVCMDELRASGKFNLMNKLKPFITENEIEINRKHGTKRQERIYVNFICFSNYSDAAALTYDDRRFWVHNVPNDRQSPAYYNRLFNWLTSDGPAHWERWLRGVDLSEFDHAAPPPMTEAKHQMVEDSMSTIKETIYDAVRDHYDIFKMDIVSAQLIEKFLVREIDDLKITGRERYEIKQCLAEMSKPLQQNQYRVPYPNQKITRQLRLKCIRNHEKWITAAADKVVEEYLRAWSVGTGATIETKQGK